MLDSSSGRGLIIFRQHVQVESVWRGEGFNWKQQSLLACILFSSRVQRSPIISFLLYCLFSKLPPSFALRSRQRHHPSPRSPFPSCPRALPSSFERFVSRTFPERPRFLSSSRSLRYIPTLPLPAARLLSLRDALSLLRQQNFFVHRLTRFRKERRVIQNHFISTKNLS